MALPLQASSLSSITDLAGNPPRYPRNPTEPKRPSLVLYIAKVPGSKDVILTTMKPRLKNVTAEDVLTSLYYLHVDGPNDALLAEDTGDVREVQGDIEPSKASIPRKPVRGGPVAASAAEAPLELNERGSNNLESSEASRLPKPGVFTVQQAFPIRKPVLPQRPPDVSLIRRPLGPRPLHSEAQMSRKPLAGDENTSLSHHVQAVTPSFQRDMKRRQSQPDIKNDAMRNVKTVTENIELPYLLQKSPTEEYFSLTLIRRDPTSGAQWNIGTICSIPWLNESRQIPRIKPSGTHAFSSASIKLTTLGYGKFRSTQVPPQVDRELSNAAGPQQFRKIQTTFDRQVRMEWSKPWERKHKQHRRGSSDPSGEDSEAKLKRNNENISGQLDSKSAERDRGHNSPECGFLSPWNSECEFSTGSSGRTLKCKHIVPSLASVSNPISDVSAAVSELRFNLPSAALANSTTSSGANSHESRLFGKSNLNHIRNKLSSDASKNGALPRPPPTSYAALYPSDEEDDSEDILDLSLGREKAGGGIRGKRAKLGKLIVHDEGLKMLDLVVAANMGIWWTVWDR